MLQNYENGMLFAFDGPSGSGKSSLAKKIAEHYNLPFLNTGKIYRLIAFHLNQKYQFEDLLQSEDLEKICFDLIEDLKKNDLIKKLGLMEPETESEECGKLASKISKFQNIRKMLEGLQREFAYKDKRGAVLEGRDIGSIILPEANFKIFITADLDVRALRRFNQLNSQNQKSGSCDLYAIKKAIMERDQEDYFREYAPLILLPEAFLLDTSKLNFDSSVQEILKYIELKKIMTLKSEKALKNQDSEFLENPCYAKGEREGH